jgi:hypothetical protein
MAFTIGMERGIIRVRFQGTMDPEDLDRLATAMFEFEGRTAPVPDRITEFTGLTGTGVLINFNDMLQLAHRRKRSGLQTPIRSALVVALPIHMGYARMFQTLNDHPMVTIRIFETVEAAEAWIFGADTSDPQR